MNESMVEVGASTQDQAANPPPPTNRRPRVREVSSRFMSPVPPSPSSSPLHNNKQKRSSSVQKQRQTEPLSCANDNRDLSRSPPQRKNQQRTMTKLFKENAGGSQDQATSISNRPDTPIVTVSSKLRLMQQRSTSTISAAARLLQTSGMSSSRSCNSNSPSSSSEGHDNHNIEGNHLAQSSLLELRSSIPETGMLPTVSSRFLADRSVNKLNGTVVHSSKFSASRSLDLPRSSSSGEYSLIQSLKAADKPAKPPVPTYAKQAADVPKKGRKVLSHQEDVHYLRLLHNHYLQWRYVNAKADASIKAHTRETKRTLYSLGVKISELYELVKRKRIELGLLQRMKTLSAILEPQMPYLEEWSTLEVDYSVALLEAIQALLNTSLRLPISGNIKADVREVGEALNSAMKLMDSMALYIQSFMPKAEEMEMLISELARVSGGEKALIEECGDLLSMTYKIQVEECSLIGQLIQLNRICGGQLQGDEQ